MKKLAAAGLAVLLVLLGAVPASAATGRRVIVYYQTVYNGSTYVSPLELTRNTTGVTDLIVGAIHLDDGGVVHLNDDPPGAAKFTPLWKDLGTLRGQGVPTLAFLGGAAQGSFQRLENDFGTYYPLLRGLIEDHSLSGLDLDVEEHLSNAAANRLIDALRADFGAGFLITLAPVATELSGGGGLSGMDYDRLYRDRGAQISWFNAQFYCGWGSLSGPGGYQGIIGRGVIPASKVVAGTVTNPANCSGYVDLPTLKSTVGSLVREYPDFGGVGGWEYFNSLPGGTSAPWQWAQQISPAVKG
ncbi:glycosyl hydrolase family 18 protein [Amycolatopsis sp. PS_44_ISF1]|uniref:glycosyl hydrolase family 18 protein n=1 Tax=Amycolatopsis sp. PS_44_ISF1 TaxID=2974917 RepID=UPI0028DF750B|nr:glycosyl hydrolase family 18 protein [Amycolatopsis sp. PS_44_ISF1]MDT8910656.1 glycosyl hydrolase family 18 protein [Amycolatopsis sp. PS_44_ISF1]